MGIKQTPTNFRVYYKTLHDAVNPKYKKAVEDYDKLYEEEIALYNDIKNKANIYEAHYRFKVNDYKEFVENTYTNGSFHNAARQLFVNKKDSYNVSAPLYALYKLARLQKELMELYKKRKKYEKILELNIKDYKKLLETFYNEVHKKLIVEGMGYVLEGSLGWICINRCKIVQGQRKMLDYKATKLKKQELLNAGLRPYNKEEAEYAEKVGKPYNGIDYRVFRNNEYCYEFPLLGNRLNIGYKIKFEVTARRGYTVGKTDEGMIEECNHDLNKICELPIDLHRKLNICLKVNDLLYLNFIRNEAQQPAYTRKANRKNRQ